MALSVRVCACICVYVVGGVYCNLIKSVREGAFYMSGQMHLNCGKMMKLEKMEESIYVCSC